MPGESTKRRSPLATCCTSPRQGASAFGRLSDAAGSDQARARSTDKRLASIFRPVDELAPGEEGGPAAEQTPPGEETAVNEVRGITAHLADVLTKGGIGTLGALRAADDKALLALPGVGAKTVEKLREAAGAAAATE